DHVAHPDLTLQNQEDADDHVAHHGLPGEADRNAHHARARQDGGGVDVDLAQRHHAGDGDDHQRSEAAQQTAHGFNPLTPFGPVAWFDFRGGKHPLQMGDEKVGDPGQDKCAGKDQQYVQARPHGPIAQLAEGDGRQTPFGPPRQDQSRHEQGNRRQQGAAEAAGLRPRSPSAQPALQEPDTGQKGRHHRRRQYRGGKQVLPERLEHHSGRSGAHETMKELRDKEHGMRNLRGWSGLLTAIVVGCLTAWAQSPIQLTVDASQAPLKVLYTHMTLPVKPGPLTLLYPKWIPGEHEPDGPIGNLTGLKFTAKGKVIPWTRDTLDVFTFHLDIPPGVSTLDVSFDYLEAVAGEYSSGGSATAKLVDVNWNQDLLYPAGIPAEQIQVDAKLLLPPDWQYGTALPVAAGNGNEVEFKTAPLDLLVDSPVIAGEYMKKIDITPPGEPIHHEWDIAADSAEALAVPPQLIEGMKNLVAETGVAFGARHYRDYHTLLTLSDHVAHFCLEHHESDDSRLPERIMLQPNGSNEVGFLLSHEFVHSWNGKFRRPADLASPPYEAPMQTDLLWVYEGLTDYLGHVFPTRAGMWTPEDFRGFMAGVAAELGPGRPGRTWKPLLDTAVSVPGMFENGDPHWINWRRDTDYYDEGDLIWLEVATIIHNQSYGSRSMEDFLHLF